MVDLKKFIGEKIKELRLKKSMTQDDLAEKLNTTKQTISRYENGDRQANQDILFQLAKIFKVSIDDFFPQIQDKYIEERKHEYKREQNRIIPLFGNIAAGCLASIDPINLHHAEYIYFPKELLGKHVNSGNLFAMKINGSSMNMIFGHGTYIICKPINKEDVKNNDIVVFSYDEEYSVKRVRFNGQSITFRPQSIDETYKPISISELTNNDLKIYGKVISYTKSLD